jgi:hypothetical protein
MSARFKKAESEKIAALDAEFERKRKRMIEGDVY